MVLRAVSPRRGFLQGSPDLPFRISASIAALQSIWLEPSGLGHGGATWQSGTAGPSAMPRPVADDNRQRHSARVEPAERNGSVAIPSPAKAVRWSPLAVAPIVGLTGHRRREARSQATVSGIPPRSPTGQCLRPPGQLRAEIMHIGAVAPETSTFWPGRTCCWKLDKASRSQLYRACDNRPT